MLTTEECLLSPIQERNPGVTRKELTGIFRDYLGVTNVLWLKNGIAGDDTHGHVDDLARFVNPTTDHYGYQKTTRRKRITNPCRKISLYSER